MREDGRLNRRTSLLVTPLFERPGGTGQAAFISSIFRRKASRLHRSQ
jgi:hypothetical protein